MSEENHNLAMTGETAQHHEVLLVEGEPFYPILKLDELPLIKDMKADLPPDISKWLRPEEQVVHIHEPGLQWPRRTVDPLEVVMRATKARHDFEMGLKGTMVASVDLGGEDPKLSRYETQHGRDALQLGFDLFDLYPRVLQNEVKSLAESQGVRNEIYIPGQPFRQERVGNIILVNRDPSDPIGQKFTRRLHWGSPYYGSIDALANFLNANALLQFKDRSYLPTETYRPRDSDGTSHPMFLAFARSVIGLENILEENDGIAAYKNLIEGGGIRNMGWRDSANAMVHSNGDWASDEFGIAPIEVQGFFYDALLNSAWVYSDLLNDFNKANELKNRAARLFDIVMEKGFVNGRFVSGFDWDSQHSLRPIDTSTSAAGRFLSSKMAKVDHPDVREKVESTIRVLFKPDMVTKWGIRTLSSDESFYVPWGYHNSVWLYDTNEVGKSLSSCGYYGLDRILGSLTENQYKKTGVPYEHVSGDDSEDDPIIPGQDIYVFNKKYQELYLWMLAPPPGQTWSASSEIARQRRYLTIPTHATDNKKFYFEREVWRGLEPHIKSIVAQFQPGLVRALEA